MTEQRPGPTPSDGEDLWVTHVLARVESPAMPAHVWSRLEERLHELGDGRLDIPAVRTQGASEVRTRRRVGTLIGGLAAACAAVVVGGLAVQSAVTTSPAPPLPPPASGLSATSALAVMHTRTAYSSAALPEQVSDVLAQTGLTSADDVRRALRRAETVRAPVLAPTGFTSAHVSIASCVRAVADALGLPTPALLVDRGTLDGRDIGLLVFDSPASSDLTIAVVDPACDPAAAPRSTMHTALP